MILSAEKRLSLIPILVANCNICKNRLAIDVVHQVIVKNIMFKTRSNFNKKDFHANLPYFEKNAQGGQTSPTNNISFQLERALSCLKYVLNISH